MDSLTRRATGVKPFKLASDPTVRAPKCCFRFREWVYKSKRGKSIRADGTLIDTYGRKPVLDYRGEPVFAELAILRLLESDGLEGRWVDSFGGKVKFRTGLLDLPARGLPAKPKVLFDRIVSAKGSRGGCWDVFAWRGKEVLFAEAKRTQKDPIRRRQQRWLTEALKVGLPLKSFLIVEWDVEQAETKLNIPRVQ